MNKKILVTGCEGFIASHLIPVLKAEGHDVRGIDIKPITNKRGNGFIQASLEHLPIDLIESFDVIIHLGALINITESFDKPWDYINNNINGMYKLQFAKRVIFASSAAVYGEFSPYGASKQLGELLLPDNSIVFRIFNPFGPGENHDNESHIIPLLAHSKTPVTLFQGGEQLRDFIHVEDVCRAFVAAVESDRTGTFDLCHTRLKIKEVADLMGVDYVLDNKKRDSGDTHTLVGDSIPLQVMFNFSFKHSVGQDLKNWRKWM